MCVRQLFRLIWDVLNYDKIRLIFREQNDTIIAKKVPYKEELPVGNNYPEIRELQQQKADYQARLNLLPYDGSPEI